MRNTPLRLFFALAIASALPCAAFAQQNSGGGLPPRGSARTDPGAKKVLGLADIGRWNRIANAALSANGRWMSYVVTPNEGDGALHVKNLDGAKEYTIPVGSAPVFSDDSRFVGYFVSPPSGAGRGGRGAAGGGGRGRGGAAEAAPATSGTRRFELLDLATGEKYAVPEGATFKFSKGSKFLAVRTNKANAAAKHNGADLVLRELSSGLTQNIGNVNLYEFDDAGDMLAYTVDAADRNGNGVTAIDLATSQSRVLSSAPLDYDQLAWSDKGTSLAVLRGDKKKENLQRDNTLLVWKDATGSAKGIEYDPAKDPAFPKGDVLSELSAPRWTRDRAKLLVGLKEQEPDPSVSPPAGEPKANVDVWHWKDDEVQSVQIVRFAQERRATLPAVFNVNSGTLVPIADSVMRNVTPTPSGKWAIGRIDTTYRTEVQW
ncbi:MAG TPA: hypothetical protein VHV78_04415, partial [Gemmatimonadaceae bacterium]|nr:hypothetical protein [Gemmatimonadaceae bacterium]